MFCSTSFVHSSCNLHTCACRSVLGNSIPKHAQLGPREHLSTSIKSKHADRPFKRHRNDIYHSLRRSCCYAAPLHTCRFSAHSCSSLLHYGSVSRLFRLSSRILHSLFRRPFSMKNNFFQPNSPRTYLLPLFPPTPPLLFPKKMRKSLTPSPPSYYP